MENGGHFLDRHRSSLVEQITNLDPVLDKMLEKDLITDEQYSLIRQGETPQERVRRLLDLVRHWGDCDKDEVQRFLQEENPRCSVFTDQGLPDLLGAHNHNDILRRSSPSTTHAVAEQGNVPDTVEQYGNIMDLECTGASMKTARMNQLKEAGSQASYIMAKEDAAKLPKYRDVIVKVAKTKNLDPALIAAIISRESRFGDLLSKGLSDDGQCFGLMQVSKNWHEIKGEWNSEEHIAQGADILVDNIKTMQRKFPQWTKAYQLKAGIAAYNCGPRQVDNDYENIDKKTVWEDYSNDVAARAQWFKKYCFTTA